MKINSTFVEIYIIFIEEIYKYYIYKLLIFKSFKKLEILL